MAANQAIVIVGPAEAKIQDVPYPVLPADDYIIVRTTAVAVNPTDWKHVESSEKLQCIGARVGCDYAGIVEEVGPGVTKDFKKGDRICGPVNGSNVVRKEDGSFGKYIAVKGDLQIRTPDNISDIQAATLGIAITTIGQSLYQSLQLPMPAAPAREPYPILVYGGSSAMGVTGIQFAKLSGLTVVATCSPRNFDYVKSLGADAVFDYNSPTAVDDIRAFTGGKLRLAWDCISQKATAEFCARCMADGEGDYSALLGGIQDAIAGVNSKIRSRTTLYYNVFGEEYWYGKRQPPVMENYEFGKTFWEVGRGLLAEGKIQPIKVTVNKGGSGLDGVLAGLQELREGKVSAEKLVYTL